MTRRHRFLKDLDRDIQDHIERETQDNIERGMSPEDARTAALRAFGNVARIKEDTREVWTVMWIERLKQDVSFAFRVLRKSPGFTIVAILTLALGIGANAVVLSVMNSFLLHPLNVPEQDSLYQIERGKDKAGTFSYPDYIDLRDRSSSFEGLVAYDIEQVGLDTGDNPNRAWIDVVSGNYFDALNIQPYLGRFFHAGDEGGAGSAPYIVLGYAYWHSHFHDDAGVVGRTVRVNKHPFTILGVAPPDFHGTLTFAYPDFYLPMVNREQVAGVNDLNQRNKKWIFMVMGHLKGGITRAQAITDLNAIGADLEKTYPNDESQMTFALARPGLYGDLLGPPVQAFLIGLSVLAALILLAACANLGSLFAARAADRSREVALRLALGAGRRRILRQLFTEAVLLSLIGGMVGILCSVVLLRELSAWQPFSRWPIHVPVNPDAKVYAAGLLLSIASGFLFGAVPVRQVLRTDPYEILKAGAIGRTRWRIAARELLLVAQIAICGVLVTSSMVAVRGLLRSLRTEFGFEPQNAVLVETDLSMAGYNAEKVPAMQKRLLDAMAAIPGVESVGLINQLPLSGGRTSSYVFSDETTDLSAANAAGNPLFYRVSPDYFRAAGTAMLSGRTFTWHDDKDAPRVAVVNQEFARRIFGSVTGATGRYFKSRDFSAGKRIEVVGVVEDGKYVTLSEYPQPAMFFPSLQMAPSSATWIVVRSNQNPQQTAEAMHMALRNLDSGLPFAIQTWTKELESSTALFAPRMATVSLGVLGVMGAMLSITGVFGMAAYSVSKRMRELGIRMALGAQRRQVLRTALGRAIQLLAFGSAVGLLLGIFASRVLAVIVYQATPRDPLVLTGVVLAMAVLGLVATWIPAQRVFSIEPLKLLREE
jgi:predicted permease